MKVNTTQVLITLLDINDNAPEVNDGIYELQENVTEENFEVITLFGLKTFIRYFSNTPSQWDH